ncbi:hypothetical protein ACH495_19155 [Micromonospora sp. NPDC018662]|uniref:hypothetical protein n=1 Tax=Micromonospora sp. NPDC018662 TaxID=3364238 RepID=UPI0037BDC2CC
MPERPTPERTALDGQAIVEILRDLNLAVRHHWLVMGAALVLHGVRPTTSDVDVAVSDVLFGRLARGSSPLRSRSGRPKVALRPNVTAYQGWIPSSWTLVRGIQVASLDSIIEEKQVLARPKDLSDIDAIRRYRTQRRSAES